MCVHRLSTVCIYARKRVSVCPIQSDAIRPANGLSGLQNSSNHIINISNDIRIKREKEGQKKKKRNGGRRGLRARARTPAHTVETIRSSSYKYY